MNENKKFILSKEPFIRKADHSENTATMMLDFLIALSPLILFAWIKNGLLPFIDGNTNFLGLIYPLLLVVLGGATSLLVEVFWYGVLIKDKPLKVRIMTSFPAIPGILLGMIVPLATPWWAIIIGALFATVIGKLIFGGFGQNVFNPALVGYIFLMIAYYSIITAGNGFLNPTEAVNAISSATPMAIFAQDRVGSVNVLLERYGLWKMFLGLTPGAVAETSSLLCLVALAYLLVRKTINWRIPVIYLATVFVLTYVIGAFNGFAGTLNYALFNLFNGGLMFGAVFMATEPVTSPRNPNGKIIYALGLGVLTVLFRFGSIEGVAISILVMNMFTAIIEKLAAKLRVQPNKKKVVLTYAIIGLLFSGIGVYSVTSVLPKEIDNPDLTYTFVSAEQKLDTFYFEYKIKVGDDEVVVTTNNSYKITAISNSTYNTDPYKAEIQKVINANKQEKAFLSVNETETALILKVRVRNEHGY
ncbi:MAG: RnfABCDGE type electron transport complex subunit D, partial [Acholeplasmataceae bacterium]|nr:RnfABCDGE type electron transport complex subunit D [Acholeplasmataceae bacterium]